MGARGLVALLAVALAAAGCGDADPVRDPSAPAVTAPGTTIPYEAGGADGSGGDGRDDDDPRGGVAAGPDSRDRATGPGGIEP